MNNSNPFIPVIMAAGIAVVGCATAFYFSDTGNTNSKKKFIINTQNFDDYGRKYKNRAKNDIFYEEEEEENVEEDEDDGGEENVEEDEEYDSGFLMPGKKKVKKAKVVRPKKQSKR